MIYSVLGDLYPANHRSAVAAAVTTGTGLGMGIGQIIAGNCSSWRLPFLIVSLPGLLCSIMVLFLVEDPKRGTKEAAVLERRRQLDMTPSTLTESERRIQRVDRLCYGNNSDSNKALENCGMDYQIPAKTIISASIKQKAETDLVTLNADHEVPVSKRSCVSCKSTCELMKIPSVVLTILQAAPGAIPFGFCVTFLNDFLQQQRGMEKEVSDTISNLSGAFLLYACSSTVLLHEINRRLPVYLYRLEPGMHWALSLVVSLATILTNVMSEVLHLSWASRSCSDACRFTSWSITLIKMQV